MPNKHRRNNLKWRLLLNLIFHIKMYKYFSPYFFGLHSEHNFFHKYFYEAKSIKYVQIYDFVDFFAKYRC